MAAARKVAYAEIVAEADAAVASLKDPELRSIAFEKVLTKLIDQDSTGPGAPGPTHPELQRPKGAGADTKARPKPKRAGPRANVEELIDEGFFAEQRTIATIRAELAHRGRHIPLTSLSGPLQALVQERRLRRQKIGVGEKASKRTYAYSIW